MLDSVEGGGCRDDPGPRGRDGTGGKVRAVNDSRCSLRLVAPLCCVCVFLRATLAPTTLAHDGDESDFVGLFSVLTDVASIVSWCHGFTSMTSMLVSPRRRNTQEYSRPWGPFLFSLVGSCLSGGEARSTAMRACGGYVFTCSPPSTSCTFAYRRLCPS